MARIFAQTLDLSKEAVTICSDGDIILIVGDEKLSVKEMMSELALLRAKVLSLEEAYMEEKLLGVSDGNSTN